MALSLSVFALCTVALFAGRASIFQPAVLLGQILFAPISFVYTYMYALVLQPVCEYTRLGVFCTVMGDHDDDDDDLATL